MWKLRTWPNLQIPYRPYLIPNRRKNYTWHFCQCHENHCRPTGPQNTQHKSWLMSALIGFSADTDMPRQRRPDKVQFLRTPYYEGSQITLPHKYKYSNIIDHNSLPVPFPNNKRKLHVCNFLILKLKRSYYILYGVLSHFATIHYPIL